MRGSVGGTGHHAHDRAVAAASQRDGQKTKVDFQARPHQVDGQAFQHDGHSADQARERQHAGVVQFPPGGAPVVGGEDGQGLFGYSAHKKSSFVRLPHKGGGNFGWDGHNAASAVAHHHAAVGCGTRTANLAVTSSCHNSPLVRHFGAAPHARIPTLRYRFLLYTGFGEMQGKVFLPLSLGDFTARSPHSLPALSRWGR